MAAVSLVSFNTKELLKNCLKALLAKKSGEQVKVWVLDNKSDDGSAEMVEREFKEVNLVKNLENTGFAKGQNILLKKIKEEFVLLLNPDTEFSAEAIDQMVEFMRQNPKCGIASCKITDFDGRLQANGGDLPTGFALVDWLFNLEVLGDLPNFHKTEESYYARAHQVGWVAGTFMMVRQEVFKKIGYLNEDYFMYFEDVEFCQRAKKVGFEVMINPDVSIKHVSGASSKDPRLNQWKGELVNLLKFYKANFGSVVAFLVKIMIYKSLILRIIAFNLIGKPDFAKTYGRIIREI